MVNRFKWNADFFAPIYTPSFNLPYKFTYKQRRACLEIIQNPDVPRYEKIKKQVKIIQSYCLIIKKRGSFRRYQEAIERKRERERETNILCFMYLFCAKGRTEPY